MPTTTSASARPPRKQSYLSISSIIAAAEITGADAIHPGYGFLSENAHFAEIVGECNLTFIGPPARGHPADGRQGPRARDREEGRRADHPRQRRRGDDGRGSGGRRALDRLSR